MGKPIVVPLLLLATLLFAPPGGGHAAGMPSGGAFLTDRHQGRGESIVPIFRSLVPKAARARIPIYFPSWIPPFILKSHQPRNEAQGRVYPVIDVYPGQWYSAALSIDPHAACKGCSRFTISGGYPHPSLADSYHHRVFLDGGRYGVVFGRKGSLWWQRSFSWEIRGRNYEIHCRCTASEYARIARSVVWVR